MNTEQLKNATEIMDKIEALKRERDRDFNTEEFRLADYNRTFIWDFRGSKKEPFTTLWSSLKEDLADLHEKYCRKITKEIVKLEKEFEKL